jgi:micrococcal nuclease
MYVFPMKLAAAVLALLGFSSQTIEGRAVTLDGDTVVVSGTHIRLKGVDAPELGQFGGLEAKRAMAAIAGNWLKCELTGEKTHGREVGFCHNARGEDIGQAIIEQGYALACPHYSLRYVKFDQPMQLQRQRRAPYC